MTMFGKAKYEYLSNIISLKSPASARQSVKLLVQEFDQAQTKTKRVRIARAAQLASNRAYATKRRKNLSPNERRQFAEIGEIYNKAADKMFKRIKRS